MFGLGPWELTIVLVILVFFYGGKRLGDIGAGLGKSISEFKKAVRDDSPARKPETQGSLARREGAGGKGTGGPAGLLEEPSFGKEEEDRYAR